MMRTIEALFDGTVFRPVEPVSLKANTRVRIVVETILPALEEATSFLQTARSLELDSPSDW